MKPENVLELMKRSAAAKKYHLIHGSTAPALSLHCVGCDYDITENPKPLHIGEWCDECWAKLTEGLD